jgi:hypothetical protein
LDCIRTCIYQSADDFWHGFDAGKEACFVEKAVVDGDIETASGSGVKEAVEACGFHKGKGYRKILGSPRRAGDLNSVS